MPTPPSPPPPSRREYTGVAVAPPAEAAMYLDCGVEPPVAVVPDEAATLYRACVLAYAFVSLPLYMHYRFAHTVRGAYMVAVAVLELFGALNVLLLGVIRYRRPWAPIVPTAPSPPDHGDGGCFWAPQSDGAGCASAFEVWVLIPACGEPDDVVFGAVRAALALADPLASRVRVVLCDDAGSPARKARLARLAPGRTRYISRPKDPSVPRHGKAGNLNYALRKIFPGRGPPGAEHVVVVFDCDMEAHADFLSAVLPFLAHESRVALVQTPQFFYNIAPSGDIFNHHNLSFYQAMQPGLDAWGATVCCGTNFAVRASALHEVGWFPTESITEDFLLSMKLSAKGHVVRFHPAVVSTGEAPEDLRQVFKQRNRWCCGCFQVFLHPGTPRLLLECRPMQALCYLNAPLSYICTLLTVPLWTIVPCLSLHAGIHPVVAITPAFGVLWLCYFSLVVLITEMMPGRLNRRSAAFLAAKANTIFWPCFVQALVSAVIGVIVPSRAKAFEVTTKKGFSADADLRRDANRSAASRDAPELSDEQATRRDGASQVTSPREPAHTGAADAAVASALVEAEAEAVSEVLADAGGGAGVESALDAAPEAGEEEAARDSSLVDIVPHQLVLSAQLLVLVAGLVKRVPKLLITHQVTHRHHAHHVGLVLVPAAWVLSSTVPMVLVVAYTYLPHAHRLHTGVIDGAWRLHSILIALVAAAMVHAAIFTGGHAGAAGAAAPRMDAPSFGLP